MTRRDKRGDQERVADILEAIARVERWARSHEQAEDDMYRAAVIRELGIIGEASVHLSGRLKARHPRIPWQQIAGLRNDVVHEYWDTAWSIIESVVVHDLPELKATLRGYGSGSTRQTEADLERQMTAALARPSLGSFGPKLAPRAFRVIDGSMKCGAWMKIARAHCILPASHGGHHRSR